MSMPISVGDAILLSQIAYGLGKAFSSGRKSAPAEFTEIQDLLYTLSEALKLLSRDLPDKALVDGGSAPREEGETDGENALLSQMIINCRSTLTHLQSLVEKYMDLDSSAEQKGERRWRDVARKNWKTIIWTKEGGDLAKLKVTLTAHINGLNLAVGAINKRHGTIVKDNVESMHSKLDDIYGWFQENLQGRKASTVPRSPPSQTSVPVEEGRLYFSVTLRALSGHQRSKLLCPRASFRLKSLDLSDMLNSTDSIFQCHCRRKFGTPDHPEELQVTLLPSSIFVRVAQPSGLTWHTYGASGTHPNRTSSIYVSDVNPLHIAEFEEQVSRVAMWQARRHLEQGRSSAFVAIQPHLTGNRVISVLESKTEIDRDTDTEANCHITFRVNYQHFVVTAGSAYSILHYKSLPESFVHASTIDTHASSFMIHQPAAELVFRVGDGHSTDPDDVENQYFVSFYHDSHIAYGENQRTVKLSNVMCVSEQTRSSSPAVVQQIKCDAVEIAFNGSLEAGECLKGLQAMQKELFNIYLQYSRCGEQIVFQRSAGDMVLRDHRIPSAQMTVVFNPLDEQYRVILQSACHSIAACMELPIHVVESLNSELDTAREYQAYFVLLDTEGTDVIKYKLKLNEFLPRGGGKSEQTFLPMPSSSPMDIS